MKKFCYLFLLLFAGAFHLTAVAFHPLNDLHPTNGPGCTPPAHLAAIPGTDGISLSWDTLGARSFLLQYKSTSDSAWISVPAHGGLRLHPLKPCTAYASRVKSYCANGDSSAFSEPITSKTLGCVDTPLCYYPIQFSFSANDTSAQLKWASVGTRGYQIQWKDQSASVWNVLNVTGNTYLLRGLQRCRSYNIFVQVVSTPPCPLPPISVTTFQTTGCTACAAPREVQAKLLDSTNVTVYWASSDTGNFIVNYRPATDSSPWTAVKTTALSYTLHGLLKCSKYVVRVDRVCATGVAPATGASVVFATGGCPQPCYAPSGQFIGSNDSVAKLAWTSTHAKSYHLRYRAAGDANFTLISLDSTSIYLHGLKKCSSYEFSVQGVCADGSVSEYGPTVTFKTTGCVTCNPPSQVQAKLLDTTNVSISWTTTDTGTFIINYRLATDSSFWTAVRTTATHYTITGLQKCKKYIVRVDRACANPNPSATDGAIVFATGGCPQPCYAPAGSIKYLGDTIVHVVWTSTGAKSYNLHYRIVGTDHYTTVHYDSAGALIYLTGLRKCTSYEFSVQGVCADGSVSEYGAPFAFKTTGCVTCNPPTQVLAKLLDTTNVTISWTTADTGIFVVNYRLAVDSATWTSVKTTATHYTITGLQKCKKYVVRVDRVCTGAINAISGESIVFATGGCPPPCYAPAGSIKYLGDTIVHVVWTNTGAKSYNLRYRITGTDHYTTVRYDSAGALIYLTGLRKCTSYEFSVQGVCGDGSVSEYGATFTFKTTGCVPTCAAPRETAAKLLDTTNVVITWATTDTGTFVVNYRLANDSAVWTSVKTTATHYTLTGLHKCSKYVVRVDRLCSTATSPAAGETISFATGGCAPPPPVCGAPRQVTAYINVDTTVILAWEPTGASSYIIQYAVAENTLAYKSIPTTANKYIITGLAPCTKYYARVRAVCPGADTAYAVLVSFTTGHCATTCNPPMYLEANPFKDSVWISWGSLASSPNYVKYPAVVEIKKAADTTGAVTDSTVLTGERLLLKIKPCIDYLVRVKTVCSNGGFSAWTEWRKFRTAGVCFAPGETPTAAAVAKVYNLFPNPGTDQAQVSYGLSQPSDVRFEVMNFQGQAVRVVPVGRQDAGDYIQALNNLGDIPPGIYFINLRVNNSVISSVKWMRSE